MLFLTSNLLKMRMGRTVGSEVGNAVEGINNVILINSLVKGPATLSPGAVIEHW